MDHSYTYSPEIEAQKKPVKMRPYLGLFLLTFGVVLSLSAGVIRWQRSQASEIRPETKMVAEVQPNAGEKQTSLSPLVAPADLGSPAESAVAGKSDSQNSATTTQFGVVNTDNPTNNCQSEIFMIGQKEASTFDHPSDEFNWVGALDVLPDYVDPFIVGQNQTQDFPWRTTQDSAGDTVNRIQFESTATTGNLEISWSPGKSGSANKLIYLDDNFLTATPERSGQFVEQAWQNMPIFKENFDLTLTTGTHTLTIKSVSAGGDPSVWDYIQLSATCPK